MIRFKRNTAIFTKGKRIMYPLLFVILSLVIVINLVYIYSGRRNSAKVEAFKVENGWGFQIVHNKKVIIKQPFIPLLQGKTAFPDKHSAKKTGIIILENIRQHKLPLITCKDLYALGIDTVPSKSR